MFRDDAAKLKTILRKHRRKRQFEAQFAHLLHGSSLASGHYSLAFAKAHPKIASFIQLEPIVANNTFQSVPDSFITNTQAQNSQQVLGEDEEMFRKHLTEKGSLPLLQSNEEIALICQCLKSLRYCSRSQIYNKIYVQYQKKGGHRSFEELRQKIQGDVLYLVKRECLKNTAGQSKAIHNLLRSVESIHE